MGTHTHTEKHTHTHIAADLSSTTNHRLGGRGPDVAATMRHPETQPSMGTRLEPLSESTHGQRLTPRPAFRLRNGATVRGDGHDTVDRQKSGDFSVQIDTSSKLRRRQPSLGQRRETGAVSENCPARLCGTWDLLNCRGDDSPNQPCVKDQPTFCREIACFVCTGLISAHAQKQRNRPQGTVPRQDFLSCGVRRSRRS
jgi:hypothetical protein